MGIHDFQTRATGFLLLEVILRWQKHIKDPKTIPSNTAASSKMASQSQSMWHAGEVLSCTLGNNPCLSSVKSVSFLSTCCSPGREGTGLRTIGPEPNKSIPWNVNQRKTKSQKVKQAGSSHRKPLGSIPGVVGPEPTKPKRI